MYVYLLYLILIFFAGDILNLVVKNYRKGKWFNNRQIISGCL